VAAALATRHHRYDHVPLTERKDHSWPGRKPLAFCLTTNVEVFAFGKGRGHDNAKHGFANRFMDRVWKCKPEDIADYCRSLQPGVIPGS
jgi:hypothetical protein